VTLSRLAFRSLSFYRRTNIASVLGVASAVAVLAGSLLVGSSVRSSLAGIATSRLGRTGVVIASENLFTEQLQQRLLPDQTVGAPILTFKGIASHDASGRRARDVHIYGIDERFFAFHGVDAKAPGRSDALLSPDLAEELAAATGDSLLVRVARPTDVPLDSLHGRREDVGRSIRLQVQGTLSRESMGEFSLAPQQGRARAVFVSLARLQRDVDPPPADTGGLSAPAEPPKRVNALLLAPAKGDALDAATVRTALPSALRPADLGLNVSVLDGGIPTIVVETSSGVMNEAMVDAVSAAAGPAGLQSTPVLTWLASRMTVGSRTVPYSLVTAIGPAAAGDDALARLLADSQPPAIVLNEWAARDLQASRGQTLEMEYYRWLDEGRLTTARASFVVSGIVPMTGLAIDRRLAPDYPGITSSESVTDWDPPFPIDLTLVRPIDEDYWRRFRTSPKAFVPLAAGQALWRTRHGQLTSIRLQPKAGGAPVDEIARTLAADVIRAIAPDRAGFTVVDVRTEQASAAVGATDFGAYFSYFSFFLMVSALLLAALFFRLGIEQRLTQSGILRATGFSLAAVRRLFLIEGGLISIAGGLGGVVLAVGWAALMMYGLRTWWVGAVGTTLLRLHIDPGALAIGAVAAVVAAIISIAITVRGLARATPRALLSGSIAEIEAHRKAVIPGHLIAIGCIAIAAVLSILSVTERIPPAAGFFGAGTLVLAAGLFAISAWLRHLSRGRMSGAGTKPPTFIRLAIANASWRPGRTVTSAGLVAAAVFLLVSVDSFRKGAASDTGPASGTGGFALIAESSLPFVHDISTPQGREVLGFESVAAPAGRRCELPESLSAAQTTDRRRTAGPGRGPAVRVCQLTRHERGRPGKSLAPAVGSRSRRRHAGHRRPDVAAVRAPCVGGRHADARRGHHASLPRPGRRLARGFDAPGRDPDRGAGVRRSLSGRRRLSNAAGGRAARLAGARRRSDAAPRRTPRALRAGRRGQRQTPRGLPPGREHVSVHLPGARRPRPPARLFRVTRDHGAQRPRAAPRAGAARRSRLRWPPTSVAGRGGNDGHRRLRPVYRRCLGAHRDRSGSRHAAQSAVDGTDADAGVGRRRRSCRGGRRDEERKTAAVGGVAPE
jgi:hypothetical protein